MAEIIPMTEEQKFQLEIYKLVMNQNAAAEEAFQFIGTDELKLELFKIHFQSGGANSDITIRTFEAVRKSKEALLVMKKFSLTLTMMITLTGNLRRNG
ncbi:DUF2560 family protein [Escherichia coli]|uniref:DUF2560 family protein n=4 Tax=Enterobacteriaceae TaxID=543 RepID=UPI002021037F|nr:DUF2560 family protein [Escherichia coli]